MKYSVMQSRLRKSILNRFSDNSEDSNSREACRSSCGDMNEKSFASQTSVYTDLQESSCLPKIKKMKLTLKRRIIDLFCNTFADNDEPEEIIFSDKAREYVEELQDIEPPWMERIRVMDKRSNDLIEFFLLDPASYVFAAEYQEEISHWHNEFAEHDNILKSLVEPLCNEKKSRWHSFVSVFSKVKRRNTSNENQILKATLIARKALKRLGNVLTY